MSRAYDEYMMGYISESEYENRKYEEDIEARRQEESQRQYEEFLREQYEREQYEKAMAQELSKRGSVMNKKTCPICNSTNYKSQTYAEECYGIVEEHSYCPHCGYTVEMCYSDPIVGFMPSITRGYRDYFGQYHKKDVRRRARLHRKYNIKRSNKDRFLSAI